MRFNEIYKLIQEGYKEAEKEFSAKSTNEEAKELIAQYKDLVNRNQVSGQERNIDYWRKQGWENFKSFVSMKSGVSSLTQIKRKKNIGKSITLDENDKWLIVVPLDKDASCFYGKDTAWCTTKPFDTYFERYFYDTNVTLIYFIHKEDLQKWAIAYTLLTTSFGKKYTEVEYFDKNDNKISDTTFEEQTGLNPHVYIEKSYGGENLEIVSKTRTDMKDAIEEAKYLIKNMQLKVNDPKIEDLLFKVKRPDLVRRYITRVGYSDTYSKKFMKMAVKLNGSNIYYFLNADDSIKKDAIQKTPEIILHIENPTKDMIKIAVYEKPDIIELIGKQDKDIYILAVNRDGRVITYIDNPDYDIQLEAVKSNNGMYTSKKITYDDDPAIMLAALTNANIYAADNLKYMLDNNFDVTEEMLNAVLYTNLPGNLTSIIPVIISNSEKFKFNALDIAMKAYKERRNED